MRVYEGRGVYGSGIVVTYEDGKTDITNLKQFKSMDNYVPMTQEIQLAISKLYQAGYALIQATGGGGINETDANRTGLIVQTFIFRKQ
ncbi:hypothetical protein AM218_11525 [Hymenobacter sp. DG25A]|nr:hypothetical protein AM218_11525 [Hymenobacter sp. DG25A]